jgi:hypothetical protein
MGHAHKILIRNPLGRENFGSLCIGEMLILKRILNKQGVRMTLNSIGSNRAQWRNLVKAIKREIFVINEAFICFSNNTVFHPIKLVSIATG